MQCKDNLIGQYAISILFTFFVMLISTPVSYSALKGGVKYSLPIYYDNLSENELCQKAESYYVTVLNLPTGTVNEDMTNALFLYSVLRNMNPENTLYSTRLGILYDLTGKDRYAKGEFSRAIGINPSDSEPYFYMGEFYYKRSFYKNALKYYKKSYECAENPSYELLYKLGDVYEKLGDTRSSLVYLKKAYELNPNAKLDNKIKHVQMQDSINNAYYSGKN